MGKSVGTIVVSCFLCSPANLVPYSIIVILASVPFLLSNEGIINSVDATFPLHPFDALVEKTVTWDTSLGFGGNASLSNPNTLPYHIMLAALGAIFQDAGLLSKIWYIAIFSLGGCSIYWFTTSFSSFEYKKFAGLAAAFLFMFNPIQVQALVHGVSNFHLVWYALPLVLGIFIKGITASGGQFARYAAIFALLYTMLQVPTDIQNRLIITIPYIGFITFYLVMGAGKRKQTTMRVLACLGMLATFNLFWIAPGALSIYEVYDIQSAGQKIYRSLDGSGESFLNIIRLSSAPSFDIHYQDAGITAAGIAIFVMILVSIAYTVKNERGEYRKIAIYLALAIAFYAILSRGTLPPFGQVYIWIFNLPGGDILLTNAPQKYVYLLILPFSFFAGHFASMSLSKLKQFLGHNKPFFVAAGIQAAAFASIFLVIMSTATPMFTHPRLNPDYPFYYMASVKMPDYYADAYAWLHGSEEDGSSRLFVVPPPAWRSYSKYTWSPYDMGEIVPNALSKQSVMDLPTLQEHNTAGQLPLIRALTDNVYSGVINVAPTLEKLNVQHILVRSDLNIGAMGHSHRLSPPAPAMVPSEQFGALSFYPVDNKGRVYFSDNVVAFVGSHNQMIHANTFPSFDSAAFHMTSTMHLNSAVKDLPVDTVIIGAASVASELRIEGDTLYVTIINSASAGDVIYNIFDVTEGAAVVTTSAGKDLAPFERATQMYSLEWLNRVGQVKISSADEITITDRDGTKISNSASVGGRLPPNKLIEKVSAGSVRLGFLFDDMHGRVSIPAGAYFDVVSNDPSIQLTLNRVGDNYIIDRSTSPAKPVFVEPGAYNFELRADIDPPVLVRMLGSEAARDYWSGPSINTGQASAPLYVEKSLTSLELFNPTDRDIVAVFTDGYSPLWQIISSDSGVIKPFVANGYAMGFQIEAYSTVSIEFIPQIMFQVTAAISILSILILIFWIITTKYPSMMRIMHRRIN